MGSDTPLAVPGHVSPFEEIKQQTEDGTEYWNSRALSRLLGYEDYRNFESVIKKAKTACKGSNQKPSDHFVDVNEMVDIGSGASRNVRNVALSRYACYLIIQNADPEKNFVALGQTYFAVQTRKQELSSLGLEDQRRLQLRAEIRKHNRILAGAAKTAGVVQPLDFAIFQNHGYRGLYGGLDKEGIRQKKRLSKRQDILDHMSSTELAANLFRATQAEEKLKRDGVATKEQANQTHYLVGKKVRQTIQELGGTMPEEIPPVESIKTVERRKKALLKQNRAVRTDPSALPE